MLILLQSISELSSALHIDSKIVIDASLVGPLLEGIFILLVSFFTRAFFFKDDCKIDSGFIMLWIDFEHFLIHRFGFVSVALLFIDYTEIEESLRACLLLRNSNFEILDCLSRVSVAGIWCSS